MTKIDIISGFLGAGKTTLIKKLLEEAYGNQKLVLIENEFGEIGIDGGFLKDAGIQINELNSGCICCSLVGDFGAALKQVITEYAPDRVIIEPSGVGKLSDVIRAVQKAGEEVPMELGTFVTVVNAPKAKVFLKNFGEFFVDQVEHAGAIILSRTQTMTDAKLEAVVALLREKNPSAPILTTPWDQLTGPQIMAAMEGGHSMLDSLLAELAAEEEEECDDPDCDCHHHDHDHDHEHHHHDHDHDHDHDHCDHEHHHHDHDHDHDHDHCDHDHDHEHHHHDHDHDHCDHDHDHEHHHHHDHDHCDHDHDHDHHHHHHHHADEVFTSWGVETTKKFTQAQLEEILEELDLGSYGMVLRAKGILPGEDGQWIHFDFTPNEVNIRTGAPDYTGRLCVIGSQLKEDGLRTLFGV
jgi:G3E family GTPase